MSGAHRAGHTDPLSVGLFAFAWTATPKSIPWPVCMVLLLPYSIGLVLFFNGTQVSGITVSIGNRAPSELFGGHVFAIRCFGLGGYNPDTISLRSW